LSLIERLDQAENQDQTLSREEQLINEWREIEQIERQAKARKEQLREEVEALLEDGIYVGDEFSHLTFQERRTLEVDSAKLLAVLGQDIYNKVSEVSVTKVRKMADAGVIAPRELAKVAKEKVSRALVNKVVKR